MIILTLQKEYGFAFSKYEQIHWKLPITSYILKKSVNESFFLCAVYIRTFSISLK